MNSFILKLAVSNKEPFIVGTRYGKVCVGSIGFGVKNSKPTFAVIDTKTTDISFFNFEFNRKSVEDKIKENNLPQQLIDILYRGSY